MDPRPKDPKIPSSGRSPSLPLPLLWLISVPLMGILLALVGVLVLVPLAGSKILASAQDFASREFGIDVGFETWEWRWSAETPALLLGIPSGFDVAGLRVSVPASGVALESRHIGLTLGLGALAQRRFVIESLEIDGLNVIQTAVSLPGSPLDLAPEVDPAVPALPPTLHETLTQGAEILNGVWTALPGGLEIRRFVLRDPRITLGNTEELAGQQVASVKGDARLHLDFHRNGRQALFKFEVSEGAALEWQRTGPDIKTGVQAEVEELGTELLWTAGGGPETARGDGEASPEARLDVPLLKLVLRNFSFQNGIDEGSGSPPSTTAETKAAFHSVEFRLASGAKAQAEPAPSPDLCAVSLVLRSLASFESEPVLRMSPCGVHVALTGPEILLPLPPSQHAKSAKSTNPPKRVKQEPVLHVVAPEARVAALFETQAELALTQSQLAGSSAPLLPLTKMQLNVRQGNNEQGDVVVTLTPLGGERLRIAPEVRLDVGELLKAVAATPLPSSQQLSAQRSKVPGSFERTQLHGSARLEVGQAWIFEALQSMGSGGAGLLRPAPGRPEISGWLSLAEDPRVASVLAKDPLKVLGSGVSLAEGPWVAAAVEGLLEDVLLSARVGLRGHKLGSWPLGDLRLSAIAVDGHVRLVLWPRAGGAVPPRVPSPSPGTTGTSGAPGVTSLTSVPALVQGILLSTPLGSWAQRDLRTLDVRASLAADEIRVVESLPSSSEGTSPEETSSASLGSSGVVGLPKVRAQLTLSVDEEGILRLVQTEAEAQVELAALSSSVAKPAGSASATLQWKLEADVAPDFSAGVLKSAATLDVPRPARLRVGDSLLGFKGRVELPVSVVGQRNNGALESLVLEANLLPQNVDVQHQKGDMLLRITRARGVMPLREQVAIRMAPPGERVFPYVLVWEPVLADNPFRRAGFKLGAPYSVSRNLVIQKLEYGAFEQGAFSRPPFVLGPFAAAWAVHQNQILVDQIDGELYSGVVTGRCFVNLDPQALAVDFSGRVSGLNGAHVLGFKGLTPAESMLGGRIALNYAIEESIVNGRIDVERIPRPLIERMLARIDPSGSDSAVASARLALGIALPGRLAVEMKEGLAELTLEVLSKGLGSSEIRIPSLPLTRVLEGQSGTLRRSLDELLDADRLQQGNGDRNRSHGTEPPAQVIPDF